MPILSARAWRRLRIATGILIVLIVVAIAALWAFMKYSVLPLADGQRLADGAVTTIIADRYGPVAIGAYLFTLRDGGVGLVDTGSDGDAKAILAALEAAHQTAADVRAIFVTHWHADHIRGARAFPAAQLYALEADVDEIARHGIRVTRGLTDGERLDISGTPVEVFAIPGHTPGSAAFLIHGVLFVGDSAGAAYNGTFQPNTMLGSDPRQTVRSLHTLIARLRSRRAEIRHVAFGHQGPLVGFDPMLTWESTAVTK